MKQYISITSTLRYGSYVYAFDKLDGSNIRAEWERKKGFWKFGSRRRLLGTDQDYIIDAQDLIKEKYEEEMNKVFEKQRYNRVVAFFEFYGGSSFAGFHIEEPHNIVLIDVNPFKSGIINPDEFIDLYGHIGIPKLVHKGNFNHEVENQIRTNQLAGITFEGVVCKMKSQHKQQHPFMFKVKTFQWLNRLKKLCNENKNLSYSDLL